jgi:hypothetical protein
MMGKRSTIAVAVLFPLLLAARIGSAADKEEAKGDKVDYKSYKSYFVSNKAGLKKESSYLTFTDQESLGKVLLKAPPNQRQKREYLPRDVFDKKIVVAVVKQGNKIWEYKVEKVTADKDTLYVQYTTSSKDGGAATYASPLILAVDRGKLASVVFLENGAKAATANIGK